MLEIRNLSKSYNTIKVLNNINLELSSGSLLGVIGSNGAGKTTLLNSIMNSFNYEGEISINGIPNHTFLKEHRKDILFLPDSPFIYDFLTGLEFIKFIMDIQKIPFEKVEKRVNILFNLFSLSDEKDYLIKEYSHGMKRKIALISLLVQSPKILLLDEPASGLDTTSIIALKEILRSLAKSGTTVILTTHLLDLVENLCDSIIIINDRQLVKHENIKSLNKNEIEKMYLNSIGAEINLQVNKFMTEENRL